MIWQKQTQRHQFISLKYEIESIRSHESLQGYVITGITDVHWEVNGLLDMWRNEKVYVDDLSKIQRADLVACKLPAYSLYEKEKIEIPVFISHYSRTNLAGAILRWNTSWGETGHCPVAESIPPGSVIELPPIRTSLPGAEKATAHRLELELRHRDGNRVAENSYCVQVLPRIIRNAATTVGLGHACESLALRLRVHGLVFAENSGNDVIMMAERYDDAVASHLDNGGRVLLIAGSEEALPRDWPLKIALRSGTELDGRWFSNFNWIRCDREPFLSVAITPVLGFESAAVAPVFVIQGFAPEQFEDVLSGITYGWLNNNCALAVQLQIGRGKLLLTTYRFDAYGTDSYTTELLNSMIAWMSSVEMQPTLTFSPSDAEAFCGDEERNARK